MRPRGVAGLVVTGLLIVVGLVVFKAQQAHDDRTVDTQTVTGGLTTAGSPTCDAAAIRTTLADEGYTAIEQIKQVRCSGGYAYAYLTPSDTSVDPADALFRAKGDAWSLLTLGTAVGTAAENGIPADGFDRIMPAGRPR